MSRFVHVTSEEHFGGSRFNGHIMEHCTFLFVDEGVYAGDKKTVSRVKGIVTESKQMVERKGISRRVPRAELSAHLGGDEPRLGRPDGATAGASCACRWDRSFATTISSTKCVQRWTVTRDARPSCTCS